MSRGDRYERRPDETTAEHCDRLWSDDIAWIKTHLPDIHIPCSTARCVRNADRILVTPRFDATAPGFIPKCPKHKHRERGDMWWRAGADVEGCARDLHHWTEAGCAGVGARFVRLLRHWDATPR